MGYAALITALMSLSLTFSSSAPKFKLRRSRGRPIVKKKSFSDPQGGTCAIGRRCHVSGKGITRFGTKFSRGRVKGLAAASATLGVPKSGRFRAICSGTLIAPTIVLTAAHCLDNLRATTSNSDTDIRVLIFNECTEATAPAGAAYQYLHGGLAQWRGCKKLRTTPQARVVKVLEQGSGHGLDYAMLAISWSNLRMPRFTAPPVPSRTFTKEVLAVSHPHGEPTQASAGKLVKQFGPNHNTGHGTDYGYATYASGGGGASGGGIYNSSGQLIGILAGYRKGHGQAFVNLARLADRTKNDPKRGRIWRWMQYGIPYKPGDPIQPVTLQW